MSRVEFLAPSALLVTLVAAGIACVTPAQNRQDSLVRIAHEYNDGLRWGRYQDVTAHLAADEAERFLARTGALGDDFEMADDEVAVNQLQGWGHARRCDGRFHLVQPASVVGAQDVRGRGLAISGRTLGVYRASPCARRPFSADHRANRRGVAALDPLTLGARVVRWGRVSVRLGLNRPAARSGRGVMARHDGRRDRRSQDNQAHDHPDHQSP